MAKAINLEQTLQTSHKTASTAAKLAGTVDVAALQRGLTADSAQLAARIYSLVLSITWPHFTFSMLPLTVFPNVHLPTFISELVGWFHSFAGVLGGKSGIAR